MLGHVLDALLRLLHPVIPFLTEALYQGLTGRESVVIAPWPTEVGVAADPAAAARVAALQKLITEIRRFRTEQRVPDSRRVAARLVGLERPASGPGWTRRARRSRRWSGWTSPATASRRRPPWRSRWRPARCSSSWTPPA